MIFMKLFNVEDRIPFVKLLMTISSSCKLCHFDVNVMLFLALPTYVFHLSTFITNDENLMI